MCLGERRIIGSGSRYYSGSLPFIRRETRRESARRPVSRVLCAPLGRATAIPLRRASRRAWRDQPGRQGGKPSHPPPRGGSAGRPYSVLLPVGFTVPPPSPGTRCALAAPFHPCPRGMLLAQAVCFLWHCPWGRPRRPLAGTAFPWSPDFPPTAGQARRSAAVRPSGGRGDRARGGVGQGRRWASSFRLLAPYREPAQPRSVSCEPTAEVPKLDEQP